MVGELFIVFLIAAASLPDDPETGRDLNKFYSGNRLYFWGLIALFQAGYTVLGIYFAGGLLSRAPAYWRIAFIGQMSLQIVVPLILMMLRSRVVHYVGIAVLFATAAWHYAPYSIN